jgi:hypothetical protein
MAVYRVKIRWSGFTGSPGYTVLHFDAPTAATTAGAQAVYDHVRTFCTYVASALPTPVQLTTDSNVEVIDQTTAQLQDIFQVTGGTGQSGGNTGGFSASTGACITWETGEIKNGRRVRGRTFLVPLSGSMYDTDGTLTSAALTDLQEGAAFLAGGGFSFGILSRPSSQGAADGSFHTVTSGRISDKTAMLRSRRD